MHYVPNLKFNLFSLTRSLSLGWTIGGSKDEGIILRMNEMSLHFDIKIHTSRGMLFCIYMQPAIKIANAANDATQ